MGGSRLNCSRLLSIIRADENRQVMRMGAKEESGKIEYHYGFYGAVHVEYEPTHVQMEYLQEHELGDEPVRMDMLIIKRDVSELSDPIGSFFCTHNVLEYKSPDDELSIDVFYKAQGYALLYKGLGKSANEIPLEELTVSLFRHKRPRKLLSMLESSGLDVRKEAPGIYRVDGRLSVPAQIIVMSELEGEEYSAFRVLAEKADEKDIISLLKLADEQPEMVDHIRAILSVSMPLNKGVFTKIKEAGIMPEALKTM